MAWERVAYQVRPRSGMPVGNNDKICILVDGVECWISSRAPAGDTGDEIELCLLLCLLSCLDRWSRRMSGRVCVGSEADEALWQRKVVSHHSTHG